jgi:subtilisin family serine protease
VINCYLSRVGKEKLLVDCLRGGEEAMKNLPMTRRILHYLLAVLFLLLPYLSSAEEPTPTMADPAPPSSPPTLGGKEEGLDAAEFKAGEIIVKFKEGIPQASVQSLLRTEDLEILDEMGQLGVMLLSVPEGRELERIEKLKRNPLVEYAEPNYVIEIGSAIAAESGYSLRTIPFPPDDPYLYHQWNLSKIEAPAAWDITTGSEKVVIAFVDSGVDLDHPELKDKIWTNPGETAGNGIDDDGNGYVDDVHGWNFVNWGREPQDDYGHGTFLAGVAAAETYNGTLMAGVSWGAEIMAVKVYRVLGPDKPATAYVYHINGGIIYAADNGAKIIHISGYVRSPACSNAMQNALNYAHSKGALVVAGSGDPDSDKTIPPDAYQYPAALNHVVSVAATDRDDERWSDSTYNDMVDVAAPGVRILSFVPGESYPLLWSSTGLAAAHVSGLAALIWSVNPNLTSNKVENIITSTAVDLGEPGRDDYFGWGRIDAAVAVMATTHHLEVEPANVIDLGRVCDHGVLPLRTITNPNTNASTWCAVPTDNWLSISGPEGLTPSSVMVSIDRSALAHYGPYTAGITAISIMTNYEHSPIIIPVTAVYTHCWTSYLPLLFKNHSSD